MLFGVKRYYVAWRYKYARPGMVNTAYGDMVGQNGSPHNSQWSGTQLAQIIVGVVLFMQMVVCYEENRDHTFKKYHAYPLSETLMALLPLNYKPEDLGGKVAWGSLAYDGMV